MAGSTGLLTLYFSKGALSNFLNDGIFAELGWRIGPLLFRGGRHCKRGEWRCEEEMVGGEGLSISRSLCRVGVNEMKGNNCQQSTRQPPPACFADFPSSTPSARRDSESNGRIRECVPVQQPETGFMGRGPPGLFVPSCSHLCNRIVQGAKMCYRWIEKTSSRSASPSPLHPVWAR